MNSAPLDMRFLSEWAVRVAAQSIKRKRVLDPWGTQRRPEQTPPPGDWLTWMIMAGRGFGKTRTGAEWVREEVMAGRARRVALVAPTAADVRDVMVEGESGLLEVCARYGVRAKYRPSKRRVEFPNGAKAWMYSADEPDRLRGPQHDLAWPDELGAWRYPEAWDMLQFGLRLGQNPRQIVTTTPRPVKAVKELVKEASDGTGRVVITGGPTTDNAANLAPAFVTRLLKRYEGTRLGRQEVIGELLIDTLGALWSMSMLDDLRLTYDEIPDLLDRERIVIGIDPAASANEESSETGIIAAMRSTAGQGYVLEDVSLRGTPDEWANAAIGAFDRWQADRIVAEANNGGLMVADVLRTRRPALPITLVHASRGKITRAEPVSALYEQARVNHVGAFPELEDQMTSYDGTGDSPDRMDALVWALTDLMVDPSPELDPAIVSAFVSLT